MSEVGSGSYRGGATTPSRVSLMFQMLRKKVALRAALEIQTTEIAATLPSLSEVEKHELIALLAADECAIDQDVTALQSEATRIVREEPAHHNVKPMQVQLSRTASKLLQQEIERRLQSGHCPDTSILIEQSVRIAYGSA